MRILCIPDAHVRAGEDLSRFESLGNYIVDLQPDAIVIMGDFLTLESLSHFDKDKRMKMEGKRYKAEVETGNLALTTLLTPMWDWNMKMFKLKKKRYNPRKIYLMGNHEYRLDRYMEYNPTFSGLADLDENMELTDMGFNIVPYREYVTLDGVDFTHVPMNKMKACEGEYVMHRVKSVTMNSTVFAHTHNFKVDTQTIRGQNRQQMLLCCGCFFEEPEDYMTGKQQDFWRGVVILNTNGDGTFDFQTVSLDLLRRNYVYK